MDIIAGLCLIAAIVCWAVPPVMLRYLRDFVPDGFTTNFVRYPIATIVYIPLLVAYSRRRPLGRFWVAALLPAAVNVGSQTLFAIAPYYLPAGVLAFLLRIATIWSVLLAFWLFPDERPLARSPLFWAAAVLAVTGFVLVWMGRPTVPISVAGIAVILGCSIFWGLYDVTVRSAMRDIHPLVVFGVIGNYTSVAVTLMAPLGQPRSLLHLDPRAMALLVVSAYIGIAIAHGLYYVALQRLGVAVSAITLLLSPFVSILAAWIFLGERLSKLQWVGAVVLVTGAALAMWSRQQLRGGPPEPAAIGPD